MRYVLVSFVFLGLVFYELSGGADFEPRGVRPAKPAAEVAKTGSEKVFDAAEPVEAAALVAKPAIAPRQAPKSAKPDTNGNATAINIRRARSSLGQGLSIFPITEPGATVELASADDGVESLAQYATRSANTPVSVKLAAVAEPEPAAPVVDIRKVNGTRVNMRDGPGTVYPVIARLSIGQKVEILDQSGTGWLRLRTVQGQQIGWVSDSLIGEN